MQRFETGLEHRLKRAARQIVDQHRHLGPIRAELGAALDGAEPERARTAYRNYAEAIEAHFRLESEVFFPALHGLHPQFARELHALDADHTRLCRDLGDLGRRIESGTIDGCAAGLAAFAAELVAHDGREEKLVEQIVALGTPLGLD